MARRINDIDQHLDETAAIHNGLPAWVFRVLVASGVNDANLMRAMNIVDRNAIKRWKAKIAEKDAKHKLAESKQ
jgi:hypothetical protein